ncbi:MAG: septation protein IspZ [Bacteriovoracaceae bacterium]|nr:septation protein IspZ [Bacteriovoracaceae bacterium]
MDLTLILFGIVPLLVFVVIDSFASMEIALIVAVLASAAECIFSIYQFGEIDYVSIASMLLIAIFAAVSYIKKTPLHFKLSPAIISGVLGIFLLVSYFLGRPLIYVMMMKYKDQMPGQMQILLQHEEFAQLMKLTSHYLGYSMLLHGLITAWAAIKLSNWWWLAIRGFGFYFLIFLAMMVARVQISL